MGRKPNENRILLYCFCSFTRSKTLFRSCGLYVFHTGAMQSAIAGRTAPSRKAKFCLQHSGINLKALGEKGKNISGFTSIIQLSIQ
jgi:hypothetical protein